MCPPRLSGSVRRPGAQYMTTQQLHLFNGLYLVIFVAVALLTRATARRIAGALAGGAVAGVLALGSIGVGEHAGWWHMAIVWEPRRVGSSKGRALARRIFFGVPSVRGAK